MWLGDSGLLPLWARCLWLLAWLPPILQFGPSGPGVHGHTSSSLGPCCHSTGLFGFLKLLLSQSKVSLLWKISLHSWSVTQREGVEKESHVNFFRGATSIAAAWLSRALPEVPHRQEIADCLSQELYPTYPCAGASCPWIMDLKSAVRWSLLMWPSSSSSLSKKTYMSSSN